MRLRLDRKMGRGFGLCGLTLLVCVSNPAVSQQSQSTLFERIQSSLDEVARGLEYVGRKAEDLIGPGLGLGEEKPAAFTERRQFSERYPTGPNPVVSVSNEFGQIRVEAWPDRVVQVQAEIVAGASDANRAAELTRAINVNVTSSENLIEIRTYHPDTRNDVGVITLGVNYLITVPREAGVITDNFFGDTSVSGVGGLVAIESKYGQLELNDLGGTVKVRAHGELPMVVRGLEKGGVFQLHGTQAEITGVAGELIVNSYRGFVRVGDLKREVSLDLFNESGTVEILLAPEEAPDVTATLIFSELQSDFPLQRTEQGKKIVARRYGAATQQQILVSSAFGVVRFGQPQVSTETPVPASTGDKPYKDTVRHALPVEGGSTLHIDAAIGNVLIQPATGNQVQVTATRIVWLPAAARAQEALETLAVSLREENGDLHLRSVATQETGNYGGSAYRIDLQIACPPAVSIALNAPNGQTNIQGMGAKLSVTQQEGSVSIIDAQGEVSVINQKGGVSIQRSQGAVDASLRYGTLELRQIGGPIRAECVEGRCIVEDAGNSVYLRNSGGDVRILAIEALAGAYDVEAERGNISMLLGSEADASLIVRAEGGRVESSIPLTGEIDREKQQFVGRLKEGAHEVRLTARNGSIALD